MDGGTGLPARGGRFPELLGTSLLMLAAIALWLIGLAAFALVVFFGLFVWWPLGVLLPLAAFGACVWRFTRAKNRGWRVAIAGAALLILALGAFFAPFSVDAFLHNRIMGRVEAAICGQPPAPTGAVVTGCSGGSVYNPSNGNTCAYPVTLRVDTALPIDALRSFYGRPELQPEGLTNLEVENYPWAEYESPGHARVDFELLGAPGTDLRCN